MGARRRSPRRSTARTCRCTEFDRTLQYRQNQYQQQYRTELSDDMRRAAAAQRRRGHGARARCSSNAPRSRATARPTLESSASIHANPNFQVDDHFERRLYDSLLAQNNLSASAYEASQRTELQVRDLRGRHRRFDVSHARRVSPLHRALQSAPRDRLRAVHGRRFLEPRDDRRACDLRALREQPG